MGELFSRYKFMRGALSRRPYKLLLLIWALVGTWDTLVAQFLPPEWAENTPNVYAGLSALSGWLTWWWWVIVGLTLLLVMSIEYGVRRQKGDAKAAGPTSDGEIQAVVIDVVENVVSVDFTKFKTGEKIRISLSNVCPDQSGSTLFLRLTSAQNHKVDRTQVNVYQLTGSGYPVVDTDLFGVPLLVPVRNEYGDVIKGWVEIDNPTGRAPRRDFRFQLTGMDERGEYVSSDGQGAYLGSPEPITLVRFAFLPGCFSSGKFILEKN